MTCRLRTERRARHPPMPTDNCLTSLTWPTSPYRSSWLVSARVPAQFPHRIGRALWMTNPVGHPIGAPGAGARAGVRELCAPRRRGLSVRVPRRGPGPRESAPRVDAALPASAHVPPPRVSLCIAPCLPLRLRRSARRSAPAWARSAHGAPQPDEPQRAARPPRARADVRLSRARPPAHELPALPHPLARRRREARPLLRPQRLALDPPGPAAQAPYERVEPVCHGRRHHLADPTPAAQPRRLPQGIPRRDDQLIWRPAWPVRRIVTA
jgi:hypothetical protein